MRPLPVHVAALRVAAGPVAAAPCDTRSASAQCSAPRRTGTHGRTQPLRSRGAAEASELCACGCRRARTLRSELASKQQQQQQQRGRTDRAPSHTSHTSQDALEIPHNRRSVPLAGPAALRRAPEPARLVRSSLAPHAASGPSWEALWAPPPSRRVFRILTGKDQPCRGRPGEVRERP